MIPINHTKTVMSLVREKTNEAILFYSGGKDSLVLLDLMRKIFDKVICVVMYFVKDLEHIEKYARYASSFENVQVVQYPHWILSIIHKEGLYCIPNPKLKKLKLSDIVNAVRSDTGIDFVFLGMKQSDSMNRRLMLKTYDQQAINWKTKTVYPLSIWKKKDVLAYIKLHRLPVPINYGVKSSKSSGLFFNEDVFNYLRNNYPSDLEKIYSVYPLSRQILFEYDYRQKAK